MSLINENPTIYEAEEDELDIEETLDYDDEEEEEPFRPQEIYRYIRHLSDPEHPLTLEQLHVVNKEHISVDNDAKKVLVQFTPTIPHCSMATLIGLSIRVKLLRSIPSKFKVRIEVFPGSHATELAINKQLNDKERVAAALENNNLLEIVNKSIRESLEKEN